jgi:predicted glycosyltransferase
MPRCCSAAAPTSPSWNAAMPETTPQRPPLLFYCQHSLGIGHLTRSFALARALLPHFRVVFLNGGRLPPGLPVPPGLVLVDLPPLGMDDGHTVVSRGAGVDVAEAQAERRRLIAQAVAEVQPAVLLVELFPFGRKKFAGEILPMIRAARRLPNGPALVACSLRDILVDARPDQAHHDERARWLAERYFDTVLAHADPAFARLEDSFRPRRPLRLPVHHTGYVVPERVTAAAPARGPHLLVSAGGGIVGEPLFSAVLAARGLMRQPLPLRLVAGPFLPEPAWQALQARVATLPGVSLVRQVPDLALEMQRARASLSQCGYNTALDLAVAGVPALVAPFETATENEQRTRAERLAALGALQCLPPGGLAPAVLARALDALLAFQPRPAALALDGAATSARCLLEAVWQRAPARARLQEAA